MFVSAWDWDAKEEGWGLGVQTMGVTALTYRRVWAGRGAEALPRVTREGFMVGGVSVRGLGVGGGGWFKWN